MECAGDSITLMGSLTLRRPRNVSRVIVGHRPEISLDTLGVPHANLNMIFFFKRTSRKQFMPLDERAANGVKRLQISLASQCMDRVDNGTIKVA